MQILIAITLTAFLAGCATSPQTPEQKADIYLSMAAENATTNNFGDAITYLDVAMDEPGQENRVRDALTKNPTLRNAYAAQTIARLGEIGTPERLRYTVIRARRMAAAQILTEAELRSIEGAVKDAARTANRSGSISFLLSSNMDVLGLLDSPDDMRIIVARSIKEEGLSRHPGLAQAIFAYAADPDTSAQNKDLIEKSFDKLYVQQEDLAFATAVFPAAGKRRAAFLQMAEGPVGTTQTVRRSVWDGLPEKSRRQIERDFRVRVVSDSEYGIVMDVQTVDRSTAGSNAGSVVGAGVAQIAYVDHSLNSMNYSPWAQLGVGVLGAMVGSAANTASVEQYQHFYTVRRGNGELFKTNEMSWSPDRITTGTCVRIADFSQAKQRICEETPAEFEGLLLGKI